MAVSKTASSYSTRLLQLTLTLLAVIYMLFIGGSFDATVRFRPQLLNAVLAGGAGLIWLIVRLKQRARLKFTGLEWPLAAVVLSQWVAAAAAAQPRLSLEAAASVTAWAIFFIIVCDLFAQGWPQAFVLNALLLVAFIVAASVLLTTGLWFAQWLRQGQWPPFALRSYRPDTFVGNPNLNAAILNLLLPLWVARLLARGSRPKRIFWAFGILVIIGAIILVASRAGWIVVVAELAFMGLLLKGKAPAGIKSWWQTRPRRQRLAALVAGLGLFGVAVWLLLPPISRYLLEARQAYWQPAWRMFLASPLTGGGPGQHLEFQARFYSVPPEGLFPHAHSLIFETLGNSGLVGSAAVAAFCIAGVWVLGRRWGRTRNRLVTAALLTGLAGAGLHHLSDYFFGTPSFTFLFLLVGALACSSSEPDASPRPSYHPAWLSLPLAVLLGVTGFALRGAAFNSLGVELALQNRWAEAGRAFRQAAQADPAFSLYWENAAQALTRAGDLNEAVPAWQQAARLEPHWALTTASLAMLTGDSNKMRQALAQAPQSYLLTLNAGLLAEEAGLSTSAQSYYRQALELSPAIANAIFWQQTPLRANVLGQWQALQPANPSPAGRGWAALQAKDYVAAQALFEQADAEAPPSIQARIGLARIWLARGDLKQAEFYLNAASNLPNFSVDDKLAFQIARGNLALARHDKNSARDAYGLVFNIVDDYMSTEGLGTYGYNTRSWWLFHREGLPGDMIPQLARADLTADIDASLAQLARGYLDDGEVETACTILARVYHEAPASESGRQWQKSCASTSP